jgi:HD-GYP domain-containing protein (c-di-GMP phosphodiesterase class II)
MIDLDNFKRVNDTEGHAGGDELLCWTVERVAEVARPMDSLGRVGGDEFAFAVPGAGLADGQKVAERLRDALASRVAISTGVGAFPANGVDAGEVLRHADQELYTAKQGERPAQAQAPGRRELSWAAALARAVDMRSAMAGGHSDRVLSYASAIAERLGWSGPELARLRMAAMLHDVGKVGLPDSVLSKPGRLREEEFAQVKEHPVTGAQLVARVEGLDPIIPWIRYSHEHLDGSGYPEGLVGEEIPLASRILLVADAFDAMTTPRPYRAAVSPEEGLEELRRCAGTHFDRRCVDALAEHLREHAVSAEG